MHVNLVDYHCHLDLFPDHAKAIKECENKKIYTLTMTTTPKAWPRNRDLTTRSLFVKAALGLHPQLVASHWQEIELWETYLTETRYIGEVGLDARPNFIGSLELQKKIFERVLRKCNQANGKILSIHSAHTAALVLDMINKYLDTEHNRVVMHWFTGSKAEAQRAIDIGCYFSLNPQMLSTKRHHEMIAILPIEKMLTESDAPFCKYRGVQVQPGEVSIVHNTVAEIKKMDQLDITKIIRSNLVTLEAL